MYFNSFIYVQYKKGSCKKKFFFNGSAIKARTDFPLPSLMALLLRKYIFFGGFSKDLFDIHTDIAGNSIFRTKRDHCKKLLQQD